MGIGEFYSVACALAWAIAVILLKRSGESMPPFALNLFKNLLMLVLLVPTMAAFSAPAVVPLPAAWIGLCLLSGLVGIALGDTLFFRTLNQLGASRTGMISTLYSPFVVLFASLFLGERLGQLQVLGFVTVLAGLALVNWPDRARELGALPPRALLTGVLSMLCMAGGIVIVKPVLSDADFLWIVLLRMLGGVAGMLLLVLLRRETGVLLAQFRGPHHWPTLIAGAFIGTYLAMMLWLAGYKYAPAPVSAILNESATAFILLLAWLFLGERLNRRQLMGCAAALGGVTLVVLG